MADELIDILDNTGKPTGEVKLKSVAHQLGLYHASVHIWFYTKNGEILFQKRADIKDTFPGLWDVSVAGHIGTGETQIQSALREIREEIGISVTKNTLTFIGTYLAEKTPTPNIFDNEFHYIYISELTTPLSSLSMQKEEVSDLALLHIDTVTKIMKDPIYWKLYVPHDKQYYALILKEIKNRL
ncbi:NUDIX hydrolase [Aquimarina mytili]|uniref:NUDIX domain-containing protein n=1 Tax=Aquimarina mytili TaxID=874423 RepID=A0A937A883_9FLAO|nr:NUDIX domain-containing protein [Aquimarina mytili]MBL0686029.1 NUDIX domain-containing protein [Aquimarina mytili]